MGKLFFNNSFTLQQLNQFLYQLQSKPISAGYFLMIVPLSQYRLPHVTRCLGCNTLQTYVVFFLWQGLHQFLVVKPVWPYYPLPIHRQANLRAFRLRHPRMKTHRGCFYIQWLHWLPNRPHYYYKCLLISFVAC